MSDKIKVGISTGDLNGIGLEIIIKTLADARILNFCTPIVYGNAKAASYYRKNIGLQDFRFNIIQDATRANPKRANIINCWDEEVRIKPGVMNEEGGKYAFISLEKATNDLISGNVDVLVTGPINKKNIQSETFDFPGHTEYIQAKTGDPSVLMLMISEGLKIGVATGHIPLGEVATKLTSEGIVEKLTLLNNTLKNDFWIRKPKIAVLGLNPHAGDNGLLGNEENSIIIPAIEEAKRKDIFVFGPYPSDGFFAGTQFRAFDGVLAMYHDQGLIPFKHIAGEGGVNFSAGLKVIRTSPDHGTAFDIAGKNLASPKSFRDAMFAAISISKNRREQKELLSNPLKTKRLSKDRD